MYLGISYKDAAHRLYMAEIERLKLTDSAAKGLSVLKERIEQTVLQDIAPVIDAVDKWELDNFVFKDGVWKQED